MPFLHTSKSGFWRANSSQVAHSRRAIRSRIKKKYAQVMVSPGAPGETFDFLRIDSPAFRL
jgi:hypothetical protein